MNSHMILKIHPQTCHLHAVNTDVYKDKLERAVRSLYHPMGVTVSVQIMPVQELPHEDYSEDWGVYQITLAGMGEAEARTIRRMAGRVFVELMKSVAARAH